MPPTAQHPSILVICGGVGAARFLRGLVDEVDASRVTAVINVADDMVLHGLAISPDIDTITYTLADAIDPDRGWGLRDESWRAMDAIARYGGGDWFSLGDQDLATHMHRTGRLAAGATLTEVTAEIADAWDVGVRLLPVSNDPISTRITRADTGDEVSFQEYFVGLQHGVPVGSVRFEGIERAQTTPEVAAAVNNADVIVIAPSNPIVSIEPVLAVPGLREHLRAASAPTVAVSPIVGGTALKGPAADMMDSLGHGADVSGVAQLWSDDIDIMLIDTIDAKRASAVRGCGVVPYVTDTIMATPERRARLARTALAAASLMPSARQGTNP